MPSHPIPAEAALRRLVKVLGELPVLRTNDELWGAYSQAVVALAAADRPPRNNSRGES